MGKYKKDLLLTLGSGKKYAVIEQCDYEGETYYFANEIINEENSQSFILFYVETNDRGKEVVKLVNDDRVFKRVCAILDKKTDEE